MSRLNIKRYKEAVANRFNNRWMELSEEDRRYTRATCPPWCGGLAAPGDHIRE